MVSTPNSLLLQVETFIRRFRSIMDSSTNSDECDALYKTERLDELERGLYEQVQEILLT